MTDQHPITPPPELVEKWRTAPWYASDREPVRMVTMTTTRVQEIADQAAQYGADQELEACCEWVENECPGYGGPYEKLRAARRPKPPSLKEQALAALKRQSTRSVPSLAATEDCDTIRRALESLDD